MHRLEDKAILWITFPVEHPSRWVEIDAFPPDIDPDDGHQSQLSVTRFEPLRATILLILHNVVLAIPTREKKRQAT